jgi:hypothetical protein
MPPSSGEKSEKYKYLVLKPLIVSVIMQIPGLGERQN